MLREACSGASAEKASELKDIVLDGRTTEEQLGLGGGTSGAGLLVGCPLKGLTMAVIARGAHGQACKIGFPSEVSRKSSTPTGGW